MRIGVARNVVIEPQPNTARNKSGALRLQLGDEKQNFGMINALSPINKPNYKVSEEKKIRPLLTEHLLTINKDIESPTGKVDKSVTVKENQLPETLAKRGSMNTFLGEGCATFLSQPSLLSKLTQQQRPAPGKIVTIIM